MSMTLEEMEQTLRALLPTQDLGVPSAHTTAHELFMSLPRWVDWWLCVRLSPIDLRERWTELPLAVMELDTLWRAWCDAWGPTGTIRRKEDWFDTADRSWRRITDLWEAWQQKGYASSRDHAQQFIPDAPTGTLGRLTDPRSPHRLDRRDQADPRSDRPGPAASDRHDAPAGSSAGRPAPAGPAVDGPAHSWPGSAPANRPDVDAGSDAHDDPPTQSWTKPWD